MTRAAASFAILLAVGIAALFFVPLSHGPYPATHGPASALRASRFFALLFLLICNLAAFLFARARSVGHLAESFGPEIYLSPIASGAVPLRC